MFTQNSQSLQASESKHSLRFFIFFLLTALSYVVFYFSLFFFDSLVLAWGSFFFLFIFLYFLAIDLFHKRKIWIRLAYFLLILIECIGLRGSTWHMYLAVVLLNSAILFLLLFLLYQLKNRSEFSSFSYFTEWGYLIAATLTLFFSVLLMGKYSQIPFTCDDIEDFPQKVVETQVDKLTQVKDFFKDWWNEVKGVFSSEDIEELPQQKTLKDFDFISNSHWFKTSKQATQTWETKTWIGAFFQNSKNYLQEEVIDIQGTISKNTCEYAMGLLRKTQLNDGLQVTVIVVLYLILIGVFKLILRVISFVGFLLFMLLKPFKIYTFKKTPSEKEIIF